MFINLEDILIAARTLYGEVRGQTYKHKRAVAHVLINRTDKKIGDRDHSLAASALRWRQFSAWNENDPNRVLLEHVDFNDKHFRECFSAVLMALNEKDFTNGSRHYHHKNISPKWAKEHSPVMFIEPHKFYNDIL